ncbi:MAG: hypothetical protein AVDCRST_MAG67-2435 [uncultured Solirubrobacteraceae bacterium]|uniref:Uncharacterized protein n=1 Tax=uncultured Solirubrobacteraceae bacterium TaxID=1162706 RepID=A0A6J4SV60_9ACTN|nr:MAG: hypothetical protein AVDCRST_MAG67-2435 [uncultured Solirubrobacteraceae bacterium]
MGSEVVVEWMALLVVNGPPMRSLAVARFRRQSFALVRLNSSLRGRLPQALAAPRGRGHPGDRANPRGPTSALAALHG